MCEVMSVRYVHHMEQDMTDIIRTYTLPLGFTATFRWRPGAPELSVE
jgi:hypothetical protein